MNKLDFWSYVPETKQQTATVTEGFLFASQHSQLDSSQFLDLKTVFPAAFN